MCHYFFCQWTTDVDTVMACKTNRVARQLIARNQCRHCVFIAETTNDSVKYATQHFCIRRIICHLSTVRLIDKSKLLLLRCTLTLFYRVSTKMVRKKNENKTAEPKKGPDKRNKTLKRTESSNKREINSTSDSNETSVHEKETMNQRKRSAKTTTGMSDQIEVFYIILQTYAYEYYSYLYF